MRVVSEERQTRVLPAREVRRGHPREGRCDVSVVTRARPGAIEVFATGKAHCKRVMESEVVEVVTERRRADTSLDFTCASLELLGAYVLGMVLTAVLQDCTTSKDPGPRETRCGEAPGIVGLFTAAVVGGVDALVTRDRRADRTYERERPPRVQTSEVECGACPLAGYVLPAQPLTGHKAVRMWPGQGYAYLAVPVPPDGQAPREVRVEQVGTAVTATGIVAIPTDQVLVARSSASGSASHGQGGAAGGACDTRQFSETGSDPVLQALERGAWLPPQAADFVERHPCQAPCRAGDDAACQLTCEIGMRLSQRLGRHGRAREALAVTKAGLPSCREVGRRARAEADRLAKEADKQPKARPAAKGAAAKKRSPRRKRRRPSAACRECFAKLKQKTKCGQPGSMFKDCEGVKQRCVTRERKCKRAEARLLGP